jgi:hypothetical protein
MRERNPCVLARRRRRGWYVRFGKAIPLKYLYAREALEITHDASPLACLCPRSESSSVLVPRAHGQETVGYSYRAGKSDTPSQREKTNNFQANSLKILNIGNLN